MKFYGFSPNFGLLTGYFKKLSNNFDEIFLHSLCGSEEVLGLLCS